MRPPRTVCVALLGLLFSCAEASPRPRGGRPVAPGAAAQRLAGGDLQLESLRGSVVLLDFFATWCAPCRAGLPRTEALVQRLAGRGLQGYAVSLDESAALVPPFVSELKLGIPVLFDEKGRLADLLGVEKLPTTVLLDRAGTVRLVSFGSNEKEEKIVADTVEALLGEH